MAKKVITEMNKKKFEQIVFFSRTVSNFEEVYGQIEEKYGELQCRLFFHLLHKFNQEESRRKRFRRALLWDDDTVECTYYF